MISRILAASLLCVAFGTGAAQAQTTHRLDTVATWGGGVNAFERAGNYGYCGRGQTFVVLDMSNENNVHQIASLNLERTVEDIVVRGNFVYVAGESTFSALVAIDVSTPAAPRITWTENAVPAPLYDPRVLAVYGNYLYLVQPDLRAAVYNLTDPARPARQLIDPPNNYYVDLYTGALVGDSARDMQIRGDLAYVVGYYGNLRIFDLSVDPLHPARRGLVNLTTPTGSRGGRIAVEGNLAIVQVEHGLQPFRNEYVVRIVDVSDPDHPVVVGGFNDLYQASGVAIQGNLAFVADWYDTTLTTKPPTVPCMFHQGPVPLNQPLPRLKGLAILDVSTPAAPVLRGVYDTQHSSISDVRVSGNRAYVMCQGQGLVTLDISNPAQPTPIPGGGYSSRGSLRQLWKDGNRLYVCDEWSGFSILDVTNPAAPVLLGGYQNEVAGPFPGSYGYKGHYNLVVRGSLAYLAGGHSGIHIVDVSTPSAPVRIGHYYDTATLDYDVKQVALRGNVLTASVLRWYGCEPSQIREDLINYDVSNPQAITVMGSVAYETVGNGFVSLKTKDDVVFGGWAEELQVFNNSDPHHPIFVGSLPFGGYDLDLVGNRLYTLQREPTSMKGLHVLDVTDPLNPSALGFYPTIGSPATLSITGARAYMGLTNGCTDVLDVSTDTPQRLHLSCDRSVSRVDILGDGDTAYAVGGQQDFGPDNRLRSGLAIVRYRCMADMDENGALNVNDFIAFQSAFAARDSRADIDRNAAFNVNDFVGFIGVYAAGCD